VIRNGVVDTSGLTAADLSGNEGALLLNQLATSKNVYTYTNDDLERLFEKAVLEITGDTAKVAPYREAMEMEIKASRSPGHKAH